MITTISLEVDILATQTRQERRAYIAHLLEAVAPAQLAFVREHRAILAKIARGPWINPDEIGLPLALLVDGVSDELLDSVEGAIATAVELPPGMVVAPIGGGMEQHFYLLCLRQRIQQESNNTLRRRQMLVEKLEAKRRELNLADAGFARLLGISRPLWSATRSGKRAASIALLRGVARAFPEMDGDVLRYLRGENGDGTRPAES
jgi:hypothetical protein